MLIERNTGRFIPGGALTSWPPADYKGASLCMGAISIKLALSQACNLNEEIPQTTVIFI